MRNRWMLFVVFLVACVVWASIPKEQEAEAGQFARQTCTVIGTTAVTIATQNTERMGWTLQDGTSGGVTIHYKFGTGATAGDWPLLPGQATGQDVNCHRGAISVAAASGTQRVCFEER